ncbi:phage integrase family protein [mine drainage metagenome]|uniref:Phage integrase family protein n=1 Tax=mine drainage metagenome TaxID=410659 RepID=T1CB58_9ZZZZ
MTPQWRGSYRENVRAVLDRDLLPRFGTQPLARIGKAEVLALRAELAQRPGKQGTLGPARINKILGVLRQILNEAADRFGLVPAFRGIKPLKLPRSEVQPFTLEEVQRILATVGRTTGIT